MKQVYRPYWEWEDFQNGMWRKLRPEDEPLHLRLAIEFTGDWARYGEAMGEVIQSWPITMLNSLSNISINRRAFLGHCAVQFKIGIPEYITRMAWKELTNMQRFKADEAAERHIRKWAVEHERKNRSIHQGMGVQMLLEWDS